MRKEVVLLARRALLLAMILLVLLFVWSAWQGFRGGPMPHWLGKMLGSDYDLAGMRIGLVAGHAGNDSGTVCADGLTEAEINATIAQAVRRDLGRRGAAVDILNEFDARLKGYRADALVAIHSDSCQVDLSGYKVASPSDGAAGSALLEECLWTRYAAATGLGQHRDTITYDMRGYHAFREIAATTPAAIIETGFMKHDRPLLQDHPDKAAAGIAAGVECMLAPAPSTTPQPAR